MIRLSESSFHTPTTRLRRLSVLMAIHNSPRLSQHKIAQMTGISSSMVNNYVKRLQQDGLVKSTGETNRTERYHLTKPGRKELFTGILKYSAEIIQLYSTTKKKVTEKLQGFHSEGIRSIAFFGAAETAQVVHAALQDTPLTLRGVVDNNLGKQGTRFKGFIVGAPESLKEMNADAVLITSFVTQEEIHGCIQQLLGDGVQVRKISDFLASTP